MADRTFNVLLGVSGSVACYRAADLARSLMREGATVRVCLTVSAAKFVSPQLFEALTGNPTLIEVFDEPVPGRMAHIDWARWADVIMVAPATANTLAKLAYGVADNMLTTIVSASTAPLIVAPAMNPQMYGSQANEAALKLLSDRGAFLVSPKEGDVACGEHGQGKLADVEAIVEETLAVVSTIRLLEGKRVLITSGPTQEPIDSVRFLSNRSSGKMGAAVARAALLMGAEVIVVAGPSAAVYPLGATVRRVRTAREMLEACIADGAACDLIVGVAAVADFRPATFFDSKIRRSGQALHLELVENPDIIATLARQFPEATTVAFAAEPSAGIEPVCEKLKRKGVDAVAANDISNVRIGFESDANELQLVLKGGEVHRSGLLSKFRCALWLLERVSEYGRSGSEIVSSS